MRSVDILIPMALAQTFIIGAQILLGTIAAVYATPYFVLISIVAYALLFIVQVFRIYQIFTILTISSKFCTCAFVEILRQ